MKLDIKPVAWVGSSKHDLSAFPAAVQDVVGYALYLAQLGGKHPDAKPLLGFGGGAVLEIVEEHAGSAYRAVYTVRLARRIYVLHCFQKKSKHGIKTPRTQLELIRSRLKRAQQEHELWLSANKFD
jgi:phage-related protein